MVAVFVFNVLVVMDVDNYFNEIRVFPERTPYTPTDNMVCIGFPNEHFLALEKDREVLISIVFTWHVETGEILKHEWSKYFKNVRIGGPAITKYSDYNNGEFIPGKFIRQGPVFTSRGCLRACKWCMVADKEGKLYTLPIKDGFIIEDSNLFACNISHIQQVIEMLKKQDNPSIFTGGIDARIFKEKYIDMLEELPIVELFWGGDSKESIPYIIYFSKILSKKPDSWKYVFCMIGFQNDLDTERKRINEIKQIGMIPCVCLFQPYGGKFVRYSEDYLTLFRENRPDTMYNKTLRSWFPEWESNIYALHS